MNNTDCIDKIGIVRKVENEKITIQLLTSEACGSCRIKTFCIKENDSVEYTSNNILENYSQLFKPGDQIKLIINKKNAYKAVFYVYFIPSFLIISFSIILSKRMNELILGVSILLFTFLYYLILGTLKKKINKKINITIKKLNYNE